MLDGLRLRVLFCEDVRREVGNKLSYMGVFGPAILAPKGQTLDKLVVAAHLHADPSAARKLTYMSVEVSQRSADGRSKILQEAEPKPTTFDEGEWNSVVGAFDPDSRPDVLTVGLVVLREVLVEEPVSVEVCVKTNLGDLRGTPLLILSNGFDSKVAPNKKVGSKPGRRKTKP